jgi:hypothetical protein
MRECFAVGLEFVAAGADEVLMLRLDAVVGREIRLLGLGFGFFSLVGIFMEDGFCVAFLEFAHLAMLLPAHSVTGQRSNFFLVSPVHSFCMSRFGLFDLPESYSPVLSGQGNPHLLPRQHFKR